MKKTIHIQKHVIEDIQKLDINLVYGMENMDFHGGEMDMGIQDFVQFVKVKLNIHIIGMENYML